MTPNRRQKPRKVSDRFTFIQVEKDDGGRVLNVSETGLCFEASSPLPRNDFLRFWFSFNLHDRIDARGKIVWTDAAKGLVGLRFVDLGPSALKQIRAWMNTNSTADNTRSENASVPATGFDAAAVRPDEARLGKAAPALNVPAFDTTLGLRDASSQVQVAPTPFKATRLVPLERYLAATRSRFIRGFLLGILISTAVFIPVFKYKSARQQGSVAQETPGRTNLSSSGAPSGNNVTKSDSDSSSTALIPSTPNQPPRSLPASQPASFSLGSPVGRHTQSLTSSPGSPKAQSPGTLSTNEQKRTKKPSATPQQLWTSVQAGNAKAAVELADLYIRGEGVPLNCDQARVLLLVASEKIDSEAIKKLRDLDKTGCPAP